mmetsp:Transcript_25079/g.62079  ORF Transcript_25079/g.62079 Transcript_25079/m.62079 type:complete len:110 (-) Transcript_25079:1317-1646(-)
MQGITSQHITSQHITAPHTTSSSKGMQSPPSRQTRNQPTNQPTSQPGNDCVSGTKCTCNHHTHHQTPQVYVYVLTHKTTRQRQTDRWVGRHGTRPTDRQASLEWYVRRE